MPARSLATTGIPDRHLCSAQQDAYRVLSVRAPASATGRGVVYGLCDSHVARLLDEAVHRSEHLRLGLTDRPETAG